MRSTASEYSTPLAAAQRYAERGLPVFPCRFRGKKPLTQHGCKDATTDLMTIAAWWQQWPPPNVGIATGTVSGLVVIDVDKKQQGIDGEETLRVLEAERGVLPETWEQITGSGGRQLFFRHPRRLVPNSTGKLGPGLDVRGDGGYVLVPPSMHPNGRLYEWKHRPEETSLADLPPAWVTLLHSNGAGRTARAGEDELIPEGQRNDTLFKLACSMRAKGASEAAIFAALLAENQARCQPPLAEGEVRRIAQSAARYESPANNGLVLIRLSAVTPAPVRWLWHSRIPLGKVTVLDGDPGLGKSLLSIDVAARVTCNRPMPDGTVSDLSEPAGVVILSAEDDSSDTLRPRFDAAGADASRVVPLPAVPGADGQRLLEISDLGAIRQAIEAVNAKFVIVDPLMAFLPAKVDSYRDQDVRRSLAPLAALAAETGVAVLVIRHLNKTGAGNPLYRGGGSIGIIGAARSGLLVAKDPQDEDRRILAVTKSNLAKTPPALAYRVVVTADEIPYLSWEGTTNHTATALLTSQAKGKDRPALEKAKEFLREVLADGPRSSEDVLEEADHAGIAERTLRRARQELGVKPTKIGRPGDKDQGWLWELPSKMAKNAEGGHQKVMATFEEFGHLQGPDDSEVF